MKENESITLPAKTAQAISTKLEKLESDYLVLKKASAEKDQALEKAHAKIAQLESKVADKQKTAAADALNTLGAAMADDYIQRDRLDPAKRAEFIEAIVSNPSQQILDLMAQDRSLVAGATQVGGPHGEKIAELGEKPLDPIAAWALSPTN